MRNLLSYHWAPAPEPAPFTPWANTLVYFPFDWDANDHSGNWYTLSATWTQETIGRRFNTAVNLVWTISQLANFQSYWMKLYTCWSWGSNTEAQVDVYPTTWYMCYQNYANYWSAAYDRVRFVYNSSWNQYDYTVWAKNNLNNWYHIVLAYSNPWGVWIFINWVKHQLTTGTSGLNPATTVNSFISNGSTTKMDVALSDVIAETTARSDADVIAYFNATKSKYWVS